MPPHDGSDMDHAEWLNGPEPCCREHGEPEPCRDCDGWREITNADAFDALGQALVRALDRIQQRDDEAMGAALARRFGGQ